MAFSDVPAGTPFHREITWITDVGIATGWGDGTFRPVQPVNRDAMAAFLYRLAEPVGYQPPAESPFTDITPQTQFYKEMAWLAEKGISTGWDDGTYRPWEPVNRDAMAAFMYRLAGEPPYEPPTRSPFVDITPETSYYKEMAWLASTGISTGWNDGTYRPTEPVNRDAMAAFIYRLAAFWPPRRESGSGNWARLLPRLGVRYWVATIKHSTSSTATFQAWTIDSGQKDIGPIVGKSGSYEGTVGMTSSGPGGRSVRGLRFAASGSWTVSLRGVEAMPQLPASGSHNGSGDQVVRVDNARGRAVTLAHSSGGTFIVMVMDVAGTWLALPVEVSGTHSSSYTIPNNAYAVEVVADGAWSITR
ncbi:MAG TPA: S-layer homology domain-containing protein [Propionibacterium sp.]|nr:S-layer homology domain-containing protein [Propionibacterium sp.]